MKKITQKQAFYFEAYRSELSIRNKLLRAAWNFVWVFFFKLSPKPFFAWRRMLLRAFGARISPSARIYPSAMVWAPWNLDLGERVLIGDRVNCYNVAGIRVEADVTISQFTFLCTASHDIESPERTLIAKPIFLQRGVWVFARAFIGMGVTVGEGAVVAACSVVVKDVDPFTVVGGNPANFLKERNASWVERVQ